MKKTLTALTQWTTDKAGMIGAFLLVLAGFIGGATYGLSSANLTIAQINATHAAEIQRLSQKQAEELKAVQDKFASTIEKKDGTSRALVHAVAERLERDNKENAHGK